MSGTEQVIKPRKTWLAGLLTFLSMPVGYMYVGRWRRGLLMGMLPIAVFGVMAWSGALSKFTGLVVAFAFIGIIYLGVVIDAVVLARRQPEYVLKPYNRWYYYGLVYIAISVLVEMLIPFRGAVFGYEPFRFPSDSMVPTVKANDFIIVNTWHYDQHSVDRGDIIVFEYPKDPSVAYAKRVIGLPGDHVTYSQKQVVLNGTPVVQTKLGDYQPENPDFGLPELKTEQVGDFPYNIVTFSDRPGFDGNYNVPEGHYFVMGDNRDNSNDSRFWGFVPQGNIKGKVLYVWFSYSKHQGKIRTDRLGLRLDQ